MLERLLRLAHHVPVVLAHLSALLAHGLAHGLPLSGAVDELDLALALRILVPVEDPDVGPDSCAVEHAVRQRDDHIDEVFFEQPLADRIRALRSEEHTSELQLLMRISYAVFCLKKKNTTINHF